MAVRKQQLGTAQALKRTQRTSLNANTMVLASPLSSPKKLIGPTTGKENTGFANAFANAMGSDPALMLLVHAGQAKASGHQKNQGEAKKSVLTQGVAVPRVCMMIQNRQMAQHSMLEQ